MFTIMIQPIINSPSVCDQVGTSISKPRAVAMPFSIGANRSVLSPADTESLPSCEFSHGMKLKAAYQQISTFQMLLTGQSWPSQLEANNTRWRARQETVWLDLWLSRSYLLLVFWFSCCSDPVAFEFLTTVNRLFPFADWWSLRFSSDPIKLHI